MAYPIYPGMDVKFQIKTDYNDFQLTEDPWKIIIKDQYGRTVSALDKGDCFWDTDGNYYFALENVRNGMVYFAFFKGSYEDEDYDDQRASVTDIQRLLAVPSVACECPCIESRQPLSCKHHRVHYRLVTTVSIDGDDYLCGLDGKYILTSDGKRICFKSDKRKQIEDMGKVVLETMTGEEFKQFIEGRNPDGEIDTIPEMIDAAKGISDEETIKEEISKEVDESDVERVTPEDLEGFEV